MLYSSSYNYLSLYFQVYLQEAEISRQIIGKDPYTPDCPVMQFSINFTKSFEANLTSLRLDFHPSTGEKEFKSLFSFLQSYICRLVDKHQIT